MVLNKFCPGLFPTQFKRFLTVESKKLKNDQREYFNDLNLNCPIYEPTTGNFETIMAFLAHRRDSVSLDALL
jgi:hypothetical protein